MTLAWTILNILAIIALMVLFVRAAKEISRQIGMYTALFFVVIVLFGSGNRASRDTVSYEPDKRAGSPTAQQIKEVVLWDNAVNTGIMLLSYRKDAGGKYQVLDRKVTVNGFVVGKQWTVKNIDIDQLGGGNTVQYHVTANVDWQLLGKTIANEGVAYTGKTTLN